MNWSDKYKLDIEELDRQHKILFLQLRNYVRDIRDKKGYDQILPTVKFLVNYTHFHLETEEEFMQEIAYPDFERHKALHDKARERIKEILITLKDEKQFVPIELYYFIANWITSHILHEDTKTKAYLESTNRKPKVKPKFECENSYIYEQISIGLEKIIIRENSNQITEDSANLRIKNFIKEFFAISKIGIDCQLEVVMDTINQDLLIPGKINLHRKDFIINAIKTTFDLGQLIKDSTNKKDLFRMLLEENFVDIGQYTDLKKAYKIQ